MSELPMTQSGQPKNGGKLLMVAVSLLIGILLGRYGLPQLPSATPTQFVTEKDGQRQLTFPTFWETWDSLHQKYIGELDDKKLFYGAISGMVQAAGDPYTSFANPEDTKQLEETLQGSFSGVGIEIGLKNGLITVIAPLEGSPAKAAGIKEGDVIVAVDKELVTQDMSIDQVVRRIRGKLGEKVTLTVISPPENKTRDVEMVRDTITIESVKSRTENGIGIITISSFNGDTADKFLSVARTMDRQGVQGIILDMRGNPGGYLSAAVDITSNFLEPGQNVVSEKGKETKDYKARRAGILRDIPVVVLVDGGSASASEIVAGALKDQRQAPIIGTKTFGKGSVQELIELEDKSSLKVTVAKWFTPSGASINEHGIEPTVAIEQNRETDTDEQLDKALEEIRNLISKQP